MARKLAPTCGRCGGDFSGGMFIELVSGKEHHAYCASAALHERQGQQPSMIAVWIALCFFPWLRAW